MARVPGSGEIPIEETPAKLAWIAVFLAGVLVFAPTFGFDFVSLDDYAYIHNNRAIQSLGLASVWEILTTPVVTIYAPLQELSYALDWAVVGDRPFLYHLHSVLWHGFNAVLAGMVVRRVGATRAAALAAGLLFAVHPAHVESVAWISGRKDLLAFGFSALALLAWLRRIEALGDRGGAARRRVAFAASVACFGLGCLSKVSAATLPGFLLLLDYGRRRRPEVPLPRDAAPWVVEKIPFALVALPVYWANQVAQTSSTAAYTEHGWTYLAVKAHAIWVYCLLATGFATGNPIHGTPVVDGALLLRAGVGTLVMAFMLTLCLRSPRGGPRPWQLWIAWIWISLLPLLVFPLPNYVADRYFYIPSLGLCALVGIAFDHLRSGNTRVPRRAVEGIFVVLLAVLSARSVHEAAFWRDSPTFWTRVVEVSTADHARLGLAAVFQDQGRHEEAEVLLRPLLARPSAALYRRLGSIYELTGRGAEAVAAYDRAIELMRREVRARSGDALSPRDRRAVAHVHYEKGMLLMRLDDFEGAARSMEAALETAPEHLRAKAKLRRMLEQTAGLLMYRIVDPQPEVLLVHPGGPPFLRKDAGFWSIPKGLIDVGEESLDGARREFQEKTSLEVAATGFISLGEVRQPDGRRVYAWAFAGDCEAQDIHSSTFERESPPRSGKRREFPEFDRAGWFDLTQAREKINPAQAAFLDRLQHHLARVPDGS